MSILIKAAAIVLLSSVCALLIKSRSPELSFAIAIMCAVTVSFAAVELLSGLRDFINEVMKLTELRPETFMPVVKCVGIAVLTRIVCELCRDAGQNGASCAVEYLGSAAAVFTVLPLMQSMLKALGELI